MKMKFVMSLAAALLFALVSLPVLATDFGGGIGGGGYAEGSFATGEFDGYAESTTTGGGMAQGNVTGDGYSASATVNAGAGHAYAGASFGLDGIDVNTGGGSFSTNLSGSIDGGGGFAETAGGVGTDYTSHAEGSFSGYGAAVQFDFGAFVGFGSF